MTRRFVYWELLAVSLLLTAVWVLAPVPAVASDNTTTTISGDVVDYTPPAKVADLAVISRSNTSLTLTWTAPGDDGSLGTASQYDIRYSTSAIDTEAKWGAATLVSNPPTPQVAGSSETFTVTGLSSGTRYYFALKTADATPNWSELSNSPLGITSSPVSYVPEYGPEEEYFVGQTSLRGKINQSGVVLRSVTAESFDERLTLTIGAGTTALTRYGTPIRLIGMYKVKESPWPPMAAYIVSLVYDLQPDGATFDPPVTLTYKYDPGYIPEDVNEEDLVLAYYDRNVSEWANLDSVVDTKAKVVTAKISHFTLLAVLAYKMIVPPAIFEYSALDVSLDRVNIGETVTISILAANTGGEPSSCMVTLKINGEVEATKYVTLAAGTSKPVSFTTIKNTAGTYLVDVEGLTGSFIVKGEPVPVTPPVEMPPAEAPPAEVPVNWPALGGAIGGVIIVGAGIFFWVRRELSRHVTPQPPAPESDDKAG